MGYYKTAILERNANAAPEFIHAANAQGVMIDPDEPTDLPIIMNYCQGMLETNRILKVEVPEMRQALSLSADTSAEGGGGCQDRANAQSHL